MLAEQQPLLTSSIFRAYDIRGIVGKTLTVQGVFLIGKALGSLLLEQGGETMIIARDGRLSGPELSKALCEGLLSTGCNVIDLGMVPTPILYYATHVLNERSGVMLTGSHNPSDYNGLKIVMNNTMLAEEGLQDLYQRIVNKQFQQGQGVYSQIDITERYVHQIASDIKLERPLHIVIDAGNGVTGHLAPRLFKALGCHVEELYCEIDGRFPHHHPDPGDASNLLDLVKVVTEKKADIGLAFDGDGDRLGVVTNAGQIIWPDRLLMLFAQALLARVPHAKIIYDVKCTHHLEKIITELGGLALMWKTGHSLIKAKMAEIGAHLAGEMSGHFFFKDRWYGFDDALYAGARLLESLSQKNETTDQIFTRIPNSVNTSELKVSVTDHEKFHLMKSLSARTDFGDAEIVTIDGLRINFKEGWGLVRPSNTTPCLIFRFEAINHAVLEQIQLVFREWLLSVKPDLVLPF